MERYNYDTAATTVNIEDITSDDANRNILRQLKDDDPTFTVLRLCQNYPNARWGYSLHGPLRQIKDYCPESARDLGWVGYFIGKNTKLGELQLLFNPLQCFHDNRTDIHAFFRGVNSNRSIQKIFFVNMNLPVGEIFQSLNPFFKKNRSLSEIVVSNCAFSVSGGCSRQLSLTLRDCNESLKCINFTDNQMGGEQSAEIIEAMSVHPQLEQLGMGGMNIEGRNKNVLALANLLSHEHPNSSLERLDVGYNNVGDEGALVFANALTKNGKLKVLDLEDNGITAEGWSGFSKVLCDTSSINKTFLSNHTLQSLGRVPNIPANIRALLESNRSNDKRQVAMKKILKHHQHFNMQPFFEWEWKVLPLAISWFERARSIEEEDVARISKRKLEVIYQFIRAMPDVFEPAPEAAGEKRKRN
jgi:hypothetical protein